MFCVDCLKRDARFPTFVCKLASKNKISSIKMSEIIDSDLTPNRKRKRDYEKACKVLENACFSNPAFSASSTPKKIIGRRRLMPTKENINPLNCMEVKSIAELVEQQKKQTKTPPPANIPTNPYEVQRKPPKKKKRETAIEEACFENPALNLNVPEKQFNPYEIVRDVSKNHEERRKCFVNAALDIKAKDAAAKLRNPFEIERNPFEIERKNVKSDNNELPTNCNENLVLNDVKPTTLKIALPFTPTVGCRIDFNNIPLTQLTPSKLLLSKKLVFSPVPVNSTLSKRSLDAISEESSSSVSIGKELDRYQLELENSINEAKMRKQDFTPETGGMTVEKECVYQLQLKVEKRVSLSTKLSDIAENEEYQTEDTKEIEVTKLETKTLQADFEKTVASVHHIETDNEKLNNAVKFEAANENMEVVKDIKLEADLKIENNCNAGFSFGSDEENDIDDIDFKAPAPFVRAYRRDNVATKCNSKESLNSNSSTKSSAENIATDMKKHNNVVKNLIRKSIRKILPNNHHHHQHEEVDGFKKLMPNDDETKHEVHEEKPCTLKSHIITSLRQSLRRKPKPKKDFEPTAVAVANSRADISIIDTSERKMKLKSTLPQNEYARIEELTNEKKHFLLRQSSLGQSTREIMKTLFQQKQEEYSFQK